MGAGASVEVAKYYVREAWTFVGDVDMRAYLWRLQTLVGALAADFEPEKKESIGARTYDASATMYYGAVHWHSNATAEEIDYAHRRVKHFMHAAELVGLANAQERELDRLQQNQAEADAFTFKHLAMQWEKELWDKYPSTLPQYKDGATDALDGWEATQQGNLWREWQRKLGGKSKGLGVLLLLIVACKRNDFPLENDEWNLWGGHLFAYRVAWIGEFVKRHVPNFAKLAEYMDPWAVEVY